MSCLPIIFLLSISYHSCHSARILGAVFTPSYSHQLAFQPIWRELSLRGHQVTVLTTNPIKDPALVNLTEIDLGMSYDIMARHKTDELLSSTKEGVLARMGKYMGALHEVSEAQLAHAQVQELVRSSAQFDVLLVEVIYPTQMALAWRFQVPFIGLVSLDAPARIHEAIGNPSHPVLYPAYDLPFDRHLSLVERAVACVHYLVMKWYEGWVLHTHADAVIKRFFGAAAPTVAELQVNMSALFINVNPVLQVVRPLGPTTVPIGRKITRSRAALPQDIQEYLDGATNGFVYFSLGSNVKSVALEDRVRGRILGALAQLPYLVLWKFEEGASGLPSNVRVVSWVPQTAVLAHRNIKGFITQGGLQSVEEAISHEVPMIVLPFYGDQGQNARVIATKKLGVRLKPAGLDQGQFLDAIMNVTTQPMYRENVREMRRLMDDEQESGLERAIWWTEYVVRHQGTRHLRAPILDLPLYQYYFLDLIAVGLAVVLVPIIGLKIIVRLVATRSKIKVH